MMGFICPQCGASYDNDDNCDERFSLILAKEFEQAEYGAVHHLSVPSYYLQHNLYSKEGWLLTRALVSQFINGGLSPKQARQDNRSKLDNKNRDFSIIKGDKLNAVADINWSFTIADVCLDSAEIYCNDIISWAKSILDDTEIVVQGNK